MVYELVADEFVAIRFGAIGKTGVMQRTNAAIDAARQMGVSYARVDSRGQGEYRGDTRVWAGRGGIGSADSSRNRGGSYQSHTYVSVFGAIAPLRQQRETCVLLRVDDVGKLLCCDNLGQDRLCCRLLRLVLTIPYVNRQLAMRALPNSANVAKVKNNKGYSPRKTKTVEHAAA